MQSSSVHICGNNSYRIHRILRLQRHSRDSIGITLGADRTVSTATVVREAAEDTIRASRIVGAARITETLRAAERDRVMEEATQTDPALYRLAEYLKEFMNE